MSFFRAAIYLLMQCRLYPYIAYLGTAHTRRRVYRTVYIIYLNCFRQEDNIGRLKKNIAEVVEAVRTYSYRFLGFSAVPLGMELEETEEWIDTQITSNSLYGIGEFTPSSEQQIMQLETIFQALYVLAVKQLNNEATLRAFFHNLAVECCYMISARTF